MNNRGHVEAADTGKRDDAMQKRDETAKLFTQIQRAVFTQDHAARFQQASGRRVRRRRRAQAQDL
jgi:hypothetical protein